MGWWTRLKNWVGGNLPETPSETWDDVVDTANDYIPDPEDYLPDWNKLIFNFFLVIVAIVIVAWVIYTS